MSAAMLGQFLEVSMRVDAPADAIEFFRSLGFRELDAIGGPAEPYAVVWDGRVAIGLRSQGLDGPALTFVRPELAWYQHAFRHAGIDFDFRQLAEDEFHRAGVADPNGQLVVLNEARTYSPSLWPAEAVPACGELLEYSIATVSLDESTAFWRRLGLQVVAEGAAPHRWSRLAGNGLVLGLHETTRFEPGLTFRAGAFEARCEYLEALGRRISQNAPVAVDTYQSATLATPWSLAVYLVGESAG